MLSDLDALTEEKLLELLQSPRLAGAARLSSPWMTPRETAEYLQISLGTLRNWTSAHFVPFCKKGRVVRYNRKTLDKWLEKGGCAGRTTMADLE